MKYKVSAFYDPLFGKPRLRSSKLLESSTKTSSQRVDSKYNELESKFRKTYANVAALYYSSENYKTAMKSFFYRSINLIEMFRSTLEDDTDDVPELFSPVSPRQASRSPKFEHRQDGSAEILRQFYAASGLPSKLREYCISKLSKQMYVIARRLEDDFLFFEQGVQNPLKEMLKVCSNISRIITARNEANVELMAIRDAIAEQEHLLQQSPGSSSMKRYEGTTDDGRLETATCKFEILNSLLKDNLKCFAALTDSFMQEWFKVYYFTTVRISYALYHFSWSSPEFRKVAFTKLHLTQEDSISDNRILSTFHAQHDVVAREVDSLGITCFRDFYDTITDSTVERILFEPSPLARFDH